MPDLSSSAQQKILELTNAYMDSFPEKVALLKSCWSRLEDSAYAENSLAELASASHKIAGSSGSYNLPEIADAAKAVEQLSSIKQWTVADDESREQDLKERFETLIILLQKQR